MGTLPAAIWLLLGALMITGIALSTWYSPYVSSAHASVVAIYESNHLRPIHAFHHLGSSLLIVLCGINLFVLLWNGAFTSRYRWLWWTSVSVAALALMFQMTGNLLPFSQHDVRTAYIEAQIGGQAPIVGDTLRQLVLGGQEVGQPTLERWYLAHRLIAPIITLFLAVPAIRAIRNEITSNSTVWIACVPILILIPAAFLLQTPHGDPATQHDFGTGATKPMWYVLPMHAMLNSISARNPDLGWIGSMLIPTIAFMVAVLLPIVFRNPDSRVHKIFGKAFAIGLVIGISLTTLNYGAATQSPFAAEPSFPPPAPVYGGDAPPATPEVIQRGQALFVKHNCLACHALGERKGGTLGPNLGRVGAKYTELSFFVELLKDPESKGITTMPAFDTLPEEDLRALAEYLRSLK